MATVADELITRYTLDARGYKRGADEVKDSTKQTAAAIKQLKASASALGDSLSSASGFAARFNASLMGVGKAAAGFAAAGIAGLIGLATYAVSAAVEMDTLRRRLLGVTQDAQRAARLMEMTKKLARESVFGTPEVAEATIKLEALGLSAERFTSVAVNLAQAMGGSNEALLDFVSLLGRAKGGNFGEVFGPEGLGRFGMGRDFFKQLGAQFDKNGQFLGTVEQALDLIEKAVNQKFGAMSRNLASGPMAQFASLMDELKFAAADVGAALLTKLLPVLTRFNDIFLGWLNDGVFVRIGEALMRVFNIDVANGPLGKGLSWLDAFVRSLPDRFVELYNALVESFNRIAKVIRTVLIFAIIAFGVQAAEAIVSFITWLGKLGKIIRELIPLMRTFATLEAIIAVISTVGEAAIPILIGLAAVTAGVAGAYLLLDKILPKAPQFDPMKVGPPGLPRLPGKAPEFDPLTPGEDGKGGMQQALNQIAGNTAATASNTQRQLDMQRYVLGGGDLGRLGVTPVELSGVRRDIKVKVDAGGSKTLDDALSEIVSRILREALRRGDLKQ